MADEIKKPEEKPQAPAQETPKVEEAAKPAPSGMDAIDSTKLKELYAKSPQMFKEAGIIPEEKPVEKKIEEPKKPESAAPLAMDGTEIKLPDDVPVNRAMVERYLAHAKEIGLNAKQVQAEIDFQTKQAREAFASQTKQPTAAEQHAAEDSANVAGLKADKEFGAAYDANMEISRRAAIKYADKEMLGKLTTSDPVLVRHFWKLGKLDADDTTRGAPNRNGEENANADKAAADQMKSRYNNSPSMFTE